MKSNHDTNGEQTMNRNEMIRDTGRMIARYTIKYRNALAFRKFEDAKRYANLQNQYVHALVNATNKEFGLALATYCTDEGTQIEANNMPVGHWLSDR
jgi:hypothetical protein